MVDQDLLSIQAARDLVESAHRAHTAVSAFNQMRIDEIGEAMAAAARDASLNLATIAHEETGYGNPADKQVKNLFAAVDVHRYFRGLRTVGVVRETQTLVEVAAPRGVVAAIIPSTNPTSTAIFKILIAIKSRNTIVLSPHPSATRCVLETVRVMREAAVRLGLPAEAIGCLEKATSEGTDALMRHPKTAVILATGGLGLVRAAYSSGKPAFGVGPGNVPAFIEASADIPKAVRDVLAGKCFDYGTICASEQALIVDRAVEDQVRAALQAEGGFFLNETQAEALGSIVVTPNRHLNPRVVGQPATTLARWAGINVPPETRCLIAPVHGVGRDYPLSLEKLSPILAWYVVDGLEEGSRLADAILHYGGMGHTASIHTRNREAALLYGQLLPAARIVVNTPSTHGAIGFSTDLAPSMTLGCGSWGGNVTSDNISPLHLMDIKRIAFETKPLAGEAGPRPVGKAFSGESVTTSVESTQKGSRPFSPVPTNARPFDAAAEIDRVIDHFLAHRVAPGRSAVSPPPAAPPAVPAAPPPTPPTPPTPPSEPKLVAVDFVSEEDVRVAIRHASRIVIDRKTILTPAARDLGGAHEVFQII
jgi:acyl-CoA reductase-like NAD-dependent aldehyde dehydrogenase